MASSEDEGKVGVEYLLGKCGVGLKSARSRYASICAQSREPGVNDGSLAAAVAADSPPAVATAASDDPFQVGPDIDCEYDSLAI